LKTVMDRDPDPQPDRLAKAGRQFAIIDGKGNVVAYTGPKATDWAGNKPCTAPNTKCTAQGNILAGPAVVDSMVARFERTPGHLAYRLVAALAGGPSARGGPRGQQAPALGVVE